MIINDSIFNYGFILLERIHRIIQNQILKGAPCPVCQAHSHLPDCEFVKVNEFLNSIPNTFKEHRETMKREEKPSPLFIGNPGIQVVPEPPNCLICEKYKHVSEAYELGIVFNMCGPCHLDWKIALEEMKPDNTYIDNLKFMKGYINRMQFEKKYGKKVVS